MSDNALQLIGACIPWKRGRKSKGKTARGYGTVGLGTENGRRRYMSAHRFAYEQKHGPIPQGKWVLHRCDNPACINPDHLFLGTAKDNALDAWRKGRLPKPPSPIGANNPKAALTDGQVLEIRRKYALGGIFQRQLAKEFGVAQPTIAAIVVGRTWKHL